jgi:hypothetical protein
MGKMYGCSPAVHYMGIVSPTYMVTAIDFACSCAFWADENHQYEESKKHAKNESLDIGREMDKYRKQLSER